MKRLRAASAVILLLLVGCSDNGLAEVSNALRTTAQAVGTFQTVVIEAETDGFISEGDARALLLVAVAVNQAGADATEATRELSKLSEADRGNLLRILTPVIDALADNSRLVDNIQNPVTKTNVNAALAAVALTLNTAQLALASR